MEYLVEKSSLYSSNQTQDRDTKANRQAAVKFHATALQVFIFFCCEQAVTLWNKETDSSCYEV